MRKDFETIKSQTLDKMVNEKDKGTQEEKLAIITGTKKTIFGHYNRS